MDDFSKRIKLIRQSLGLKRERFAQMMGFPEITVRSWEHKKVIPHQTSLNKLIQSIAKTGLPVTKEWLMNGTGSSPFGIDFQQISMISEKDIFILKNPGAIFFDIADNKFLPTFKKGDVIGAVPCPLPDHLDMVILQTTSKANPFAFYRVYKTPQEAKVLMPLHDPAGKALLYDKETMSLYRAALTLSPSPASSP